MARRILEYTFKRKRRTACVALLLFLVLFVLYQLPFSFWGGDSFRISTETTFILKPIRDDGSVDYATYVNNRLGANELPEQNVMVTLMKTVNVYDELESDVRDLLIQLAPSDTISTTRLESSAEIVLRVYPNNSWDENNNIAYEISDRPWTRNEFPEVADELRKQDHLIGGVLTALDKPTFFIPITSIDEDQPSVIRSVPRQLARLLFCHAMLHLGENQVERALKCAAGIRRASYHLHSTHLILNCLTASALDGLAFKIEQYVFEQPKIPLPSLREHFDIVTAFDDDKSLAEISNFEFRFPLLARIQSCALYGDDPTASPIKKRTGQHDMMFRLRRLTDWNEALVTANEISNELLLAASEPQSHQRKRKINEVLTQLESDVSLKSTSTNTSFAMLLGPKARGRWFALRFTRHLWPIGVTEIMAREAIIRDIVAVSIAVEIYRMETGQLPHQLTDLVPIYLDAIPIDRLTGQDFSFEIRNNEYVVSGSHKEATLTRKYDVFEFC